MPCIPFDINGVRGIACTRGRARTPKCSVCKTRQGTQLCDGKLGGGKTCDVPLCHQCAQKPRKNVDLCPKHREGQGGQYGPSPLDERNFQ